MLKILIPSLIVTGLSTQIALVDAPPKKLDPAAWGADHVGKPIQEYVAGDVCLFCHRKKIAQEWGENRHNLTIRMPEEKSPALLALPKSMREEVDFVMGRRRVEYLKKSKAYGKLEILSSKPHWDTKKFGQSCAGCHTTRVDPKDQSFLALSIDCFACHGDVDLKHSKKPELVYLAKKRKDPARVVTSICAQCHIRGGKSKSTGRPYPCNFVPGDNLFRDFKVDFSDKHLNILNVADRHIMENVRDVVLYGKEKVTCLSCHDVHDQSSKKHHRVKWSNICLNCHNATGSKKKRKPFTTHSKTCEYRGSK